MRALVDILVATLSRVCTIKKPGHKEDHILCNCISNIYYTVHAQYVNSIKCTELHPSHIEFKNATELYYSIQLHFKNKP